MDSLELVRRASRVIGARLTFLGLIVHNVAAHKLRAALTAFAVAIGVMAVVALGVLTFSLKETATGILKVGNADFTVAQKHVDNILNSTIGEDDIKELGSVPGVADAIGALVELEKYDSGHPAVIQVGLDPAAQDPFGVVLLEGRSYRATSNDEVMLGYQLASSLDKAVGDRLTIDDHTYRVTGLYRTNVSFGNSTMMFPVGYGEFVVVYGPSGSGKSTLMHLLAALDRADRGHITVNGLDLMRLHQPTKFRRFDVGLVFQLHNLVPRVTARQNVEMAMFGTHRGRRERRARAVELLDQVGLADRADHKPPTMSGGERQRVAIARALANDPPILLGDEPTGSLDDDSAASVIDLFTSLQSERDVTILAVSHDPRLNAAAARRLRLANGQIVDLAATRAGSVEATAGGDDGTGGEDHIDEAIGSGRGVGPDGSSR